MNSLFSLPRGAAWTDRRRPNSTDSSLAKPVSPKSFESTDAGGAPPQSLVKPSGSADGQDDHAIADLKTLARRVRLKGFESSDAGGASPQSLVKPSGSAEAEDDRAIADLKALARRVGLKGFS